VTRTAPLSEKEREFVEHDAHEQSTSHEAPASATPGHRSNLGDVSGLNLSLSEGERDFAQREVDEQLGTTALFLPESARVEGR
jgi:hypothetical protein